MGCFSNGPSSTNAGWYRVFQQIAMSALIDHSTYPAWSAVESRVGCQLLRGMVSRRMVNITEADIRSGIVGAVVVILLIPLVWVGNLALERFVREPVREWWSARSKKRALKLADQMVQKFKEDIELLSDVARLVIVKGQMIMQVVLRVGSELSLWRFFVRLLLVRDPSASAPGLLVVDAQTSSAVLTGVVLLLAVVTIGHQYASKIERVMVIN